MLTRLGFHPDVITKATPFYGTEFGHAGLSGVVPVCISATPYVARSSLLPGEIAAAMLVDTLRWLAVRSGFRSHGHVDQVASTSLSGLFETILTDHFTCPGLIGGLYDTENFSPENLVVRFNACVSRTQELTTVPPPAFACYPPPPFAYPGGNGKHPPLPQLRALSAITDALLGLVLPILPPLPPPMITGGGSNQVSSAEDSFAVQNSMVDHARSFLAHLPSLLVPVRGMLAALLTNTHAVSWSMMLEAISVYAVRALANTCDALVTYDISHEKSPLMVGETTLASMWTVSSPRKRKSLGVYHQSTIKVAGTAIGSASKVPRVEGGSPQDEYRFVTTVKVPPLFLPQKACVTPSMHPLLQSVHSARGDMAAYTNRLEASFLEGSTGNGGGNGDEQCAARHRPSPLSTANFPGATGSPVQFGTELGLQV